MAFYKFSSGDDDFAPYYVIRIRMTVNNQNTS